MKRSDTLMANEAAVSNKQMLEEPINDFPVCDAVLLAAKSVGEHHASTKT